MTSTGSHFLLAVTTLLSHAKCQCWPHKYKLRIIQ